MKKKIFVALIAAFASGFSVAVAFLDHGTNVTSPRDEVTQAHPPGGSGSIPRKPESAFALTPNVPSADPEDKAPTAPDPIAEEQAALEDLARRARAGEYILGSENPSMVRTRREMLQRAIERDLPPLMTARQELLAPLGVPPDTIAKLTNHAAKIAEASLAVRPLLEEVSVAKVEYDAKARELLTPEQYEKVREFETRQALEREWERYKVDGVENLSITDLNAISRSLEELGIREKHPSSILPYEPPPSTSNWLSGKNSDVRQIMLDKISRLNAAAADLSAIAERNQLSDQGRQVLASMIANRGRSLHERFSNMPTDEQLRARSRAIIQAHVRQSAN